MNLTVSRVKAEMKGEIVTVEMIKEKRGDCCYKDIDNMKKDCYYRINSRDKREYCSCRSIASIEKIKEHYSRDIASIDK